MTTLKNATEMDTSEYLLSLGIESFKDEAAEGEIVDPDAVSLLDDEVAGMHAFVTEQEALAGSIEQMIVIADGLESLGSTIHKRELSPTSKTLVGLMDHALPCALNRPTVSLELLEAAGGLTLSGVIQGIWRMIKAILKQIKDNFGSLTRLLSTSIPNLIELLENNALFTADLALPARSAVKSALLENNALFTADLAGKAHNGQPVKMGQESKFLAIEGRNTLTDGKTLVTEVERLMVLSKVIFEQYGSELVNVGIGVYNAISSIDPNDPEEGLRLATEQVSARSSAPIRADHGFVMREVYGKHPVGVVTQQIEMDVMRSPRFNKGVLASEPFIGNQQLQLIEKQIDQKQIRTQTFEAEAQSLQGLPLEFVNTRAIARSNITRDQDFEGQLEPVDIAKLCNSAINMLIAIQHFNAPTIAKRLDMSRAAIEKVSQTMSTKVEQMTEYSPEMVNHYRTAMEFNIAYAAWTTKPMGMLAIHVMQVCRTILKLTNGSINCYLK